MTRISERRVETTFPEITSDRKSRILIVSYNYAPMQSPRAFRWSAIAREWAKQGVEVHVVAAWKTGLGREETIDGVHVHRVGARLFAKFNGAAGSPSATGSNTRNGNGSLLKKVVKHLHDATWKNLYWPDYAYAWYYPALREAERLVVREQYDALISVSHPFTGHLVGLQIKKKHDALPWLVDIGDPFSLLNGIKPNNVSLYKSLNRSVEQKVLRRCDRIAVTTDGARDLYAKQWPFSESKTDIIYPLVDLDAINNSQGVDREFEPDTKDRKLHIVYVGNLYTNTRNPRPCVELFGELARRHPEMAKDLSIKFYGGIDNDSMFDAAKNIPDTMVEWCGPVPREQALKLQAEADILLYIGNNNSYQLPSKIVEYMAFGKPILNFFSVEDDQSLKLLKNYPVRQDIDLSASDESRKARRVDSIARFIRIVQGMPPQHRWTLADSARKLTDEFTAETIAGNYLKAVDSMRMGAK